MSDELPIEPTTPPPLPSPWYPPPASGYAPAPAPLGAARGFGPAIAAGIVGAVLVFGFASYGIGGYVVASNRVSSAAGVINEVDTHRPSINSSFDDIQNMLTSPALVSPTMARSMATEMVSRSQVLASAVAGYGPSLREAQLNLSDLNWLTALSRGRLQDESVRIDHARKAVADMRNAAEDYRVLGVFFTSYFQVFVDWDNLETASMSNDNAGYSAALLVLQSDIATALQMATPPYLSSAHHDQLTAIQAEFDDLKKEQLANANGDLAGAAAAKKAYNADVQRANAVDFSTNVTAILSHYQRYRDDFNTEMDKATV